MLAIASDWLAVKRWQGHYQAHSAVTQPPTDRAPGRLAPGLGRGRESPDPNGPSGRPASGGGRCGGGQVFHLLSPWGNTPTPSFASALVSFLCLWRLTRRRCVIPLNVQIHATRLCSHLLPSPDPRVHHPYRQDARLLHTVHHLRILHAHMLRGAKNRILPGPPLGHVYGRHLLHPAGGGQHVAKLLHVDPRVCGRGRWRGGAVDKSGHLHVPLRCARGGVHGRARGRGDGPLQRLVLDGVSVQRRGGPAASRVFGDSEFFSLAAQRTAAT
jgi:hypothetical protein